jgi:hypothetical protein
MNLKNRIEELNTNLVLQETKMLLVIDNLKSLILKTDSNSKKSFFIAINELQHFKNEYNSIFIQLKTLTAYQSGVKT